MSQNAGATGSSDEIRKRLLILIEAQVSGFDPSEGIKQQLDSLALMALITEIESQFKVRFYTVEIASNRWASIDDVVEMIVEKLLNTTDREK